MKVISYLNDIPLDQVCEEELREFAREAQIKMLKIAGYTPVDEKDNKKTA